MPRDRAGRTRRRRLRRKSSAVIVAIGAALIAALFVLSLFVHPSHALPGAGS